MEAVNFEKIGNNFGADPMLFYAMMFCVDKISLVLHHVCIKWILRYAVDILYTDFEPVFCEIASGLPERGFA